MVLGVCPEPPPPPPPPRTKWTRRVPHPVLIGHAASLSQVCKQGTEQPCGPECARLAVCLRLLEAQDSRWAATQQPRPRDAWERFVKTKNRLHRNRRHVLRPYYTADDLDVLCAAGAEVRAREVPAVPR